MITLYTIDCHNCKRLEEKLNSCNVEYSVCRDRELMASKGITCLPVLEVNGTSMNFKEAMKWTNEQRKETV